MTINKQNLKTKYRQVCKIIFNHQSQSHYTNCPSFSICRSKSSSI